MKNIKTEPTKTVLTIAVGFIVIYFVTKWMPALWVALIVGLIGVFSTYLTEKIDFLWMKLAWVLSLIVPNILLTIIFYLFLFPIALLAKIFGNKDPLRLKNTGASNFVNCEKEFDKASFEKPY